MKKAKLNTKAQLNVERTHQTRTPKVTNVQNGRDAKDNPMRPYGPYRHTVPNAYEIRTADIYVRSVL